MTDAVELNPETLIPVNPPAAAPAAPAPAPVAATPAPAPSATVEGQEDGTEELDAQGQPKKPIQPRINELVRKRHEAEREAAYWRGVATSNGTAPKQAQAPVAAPAPAEVPRPVASNFQTYDEYVDALTDWKVAKALAPALADVNKSIEERSATQTKAQQDSERQSNWQKRQDATKAVIKDYDEVVATSDIPIAKHVGELLIESEHGPALAYKLAQDPALADKLNKMTPTAAAIHIGRLEMAFEPAADSPAPANAPAAPAAPVKAVSKAPIPPTPVNMNSARSPDISKMSMDDYVKARKAQGAGWAR